MVGQRTLPTASAAVGPVRSGVKVTGPPLAPVGSMVAESE